MIYMAPIAPPALLNTHSDESVLKTMGEGVFWKGIVHIDVDGGNWGCSVVRFVTIWLMIPFMLSP